MPEIIKAKTAGFCPGVRSAVMTVYRLLDENKGIICTIGPIIHNRQVVEDLKSRGVKVFDRVCDIKGCSHAVIRAHGVPPEVYSELKENDIDYIDATCPYVKKIHELVSKRKDENYKIIIAGDRNHPEVIGINGWSGGTASTVSTPAEAAKLEADPEARVCVVGQTTITRENWDEIIKVLAGRFRNIEINDTLCSASLNRQKEAEEIASAADIMIVIGGSDSSNTQKLFEICSRHCEETYKVETADDLPELMTGLKLKLSENRSKTTADKKDAGERRHIRKIGVTAGASTPEQIIGEVIDKMTDRFDIEETEMDFAEALENSVVALQSGTIIKGRIFGYNSSEVFIDIGYKADGIIELSQFSDDPEFDPAKSIRIGEEVEVYVVRVNDGEGNVILSKRKVDQLHKADLIENAYNNNEAIEVKVTEIVNAGVIATSGGTGIFIPASLLGDRPSKDLNLYKGRNIKIKIIEYNKDRRKIIGSERIVLKENQEVKAVELWDSIEAGKIYTGTVRNIAEFGAFVDIGGADGLIHMSELSWDRVKHPSEILNTGDVIEVRVLSFDKEKKKISLSYRKAEDNPWLSAAARYQEGATVKGKVARLMPFGAFISLEPGIDGLVHISKISEKRITKPGEVLKTGQEVEARIIEVNIEQRKISLSMVDADADAVADADMSAEKSVPGEVAKTGEPGTTEAAEVAEAANVPEKTDGSDTAPVTTEALEVTKGTALQLKK